MPPSAARSLSTRSNVFLIPAEMSTSGSVPASVSPAMATAPVLERLRSFPTELVPDNPTRESSRWKTKCKSAPLARVLEQTITPFASTSAGPTPRLLGHLRLRLRPRLHRLGWPQRRASRSPGRSSYRQSSLQPHRPRPQLRRRRRLRCPLRCCRLTSLPSRRLPPRPSLPQGHLSSNLWPLRLLRRLPPVRQLLRPRRRRHRPWYWPPHERRPALQLHLGHLLQQTRNHHGLPPSWLPRRLTLLRTQRRPAASPWAFAFLSTHPSSDVRRHPRVHHRHPAGHHRRRHDSPAAHVLRRPRAPPARRSRVHLEPRCPGSG
jgi:hypothetical protein